MLQLQENIKKIFCFHINFVFGSMKIYFYLKVVYFIVFRHTNGKKLNFFTDYPLPFYSDSSKNKKTLPGSPELPNNGVVPASSILPVCYDHAYSEPTSNSSCGNKSTTGFGLESMYEEQYSVLANKDNYSGKETPASEHHYDVPLIGSSLDSPISSETHHLLASHRQLSTPTKECGIFGGKIDSPMSSLEKSARSGSPLSSASEPTSGNSKNNLNKLYLQLIQILMKFWLIYIYIFFNLG